jgi:hypothetical protein
MRDGSTAENMGGTSFLAAADHIATDISDEFEELTLYSKDEFLNRPVEDTFQTLRVSRDARTRLVETGETECYLFTKTLEPREVRITRLTSTGAKNETYSFSETPNPRLNDKTVFIDHLLSSEKIGTAIFSVPELILLKANERYLEEARCHLVMRRPVSARLFAT